MCYAETRLRDDRGMPPLEGMLGTANICAPFGSAIGCHVIKINPQGVFDISVFNWLRLVGQVS